MIPIEELIGLQSRPCAEVEDLLAWLVTHGCDEVVISRTDDDGGWCVCCRHEGGGWLARADDTIWAALVAMVAELAS